MLQRPAPAKLNLGLHVLRRRADGFHDLETVFLRIPWADHLTAHPADALTLTCSDPALPTNADNLVLRAALALQAATGTPAGAALHLDKRLPYGAGLGSGSSDAAHTLLLLNELWGCAAPPEMLHRLAADLGSDVPFFLTGEAAYATGRGEVLTPMAYTCPFALVVAVPPVHISTADAYGRVRPSDHARPDLRAVVASNDLARWRNALINDFEAPICAAYPAVAATREALYAAGAGYAALSGSGAAVFGVFADAAAARQAADGLRGDPGMRVWVSG